MPIEEAQNVNFLIRQREGGREVGMNGMVEMITKTPFLLVIFT